MVYCGKVSRSCKQCRKRDIKCDKKRPSCGQCIRAKIECLGYSDSKEFVFMDNTETTIQRSSKQNRPSIPKPILQTAENNAKMYFVSRYTLADASPFDYIKAFWPMRLQLAHMDEAVRAVGLALFAKEFGVSSMLHGARRKYGSALILTNQILQNSSLATHDTTLFTVLLLDLFERLMRKDQKPVPGISKHIDGAYAIVGLRGSSQFSDPISLRIFQQFAANTIMSCLDLGIAAPATFLTLYNQGSHHSGPNDLEWRFLDVLIEYVTLSGSSEEKDISDETIRGIYLINQKLEEINRAVSTQVSAAGFGTIFSVSTHWSDCYHKYRLIQLNNNIRSLQLILIENHLRCSQMHFSNVNSGFLGQSQNYSSVANTLRSEICISALRSLYKEEFARHLPPSSLSIIDIHNLRPYSIELQNQAKTLIFPLWTAFSTKGCEAKTRKWILDCLTIIADKFELSQAAIARSSIEADEVKSPWSIAASLGTFPLCT